MSWHSGRSSTLIGQSDICHPWIRFCYCHTCRVLSTRINTTSRSLWSVCSGRLYISLCSTMYYWIQISCICHLVVWYAIYTCIWSIHCSDCIVQCYVYLQCVSLTEHMFGYEHADISCFVRSCGFMLYETISYYKYVYLYIRAVNVILKTISQRRHV